MHGSRRAGRRARGQARSVTATAVVLSVGLVATGLAACGSATGAGVAGADGVSAVTTAPATRAPTTAPASRATSTTATTLPVTPVAWAPCQNGLQCGSIQVPLDYASAGSPLITLALARRPALDPAQRIGSIVINPGGPGGSGIDDLPSELRVLTGGLLDRFDIVSFDPRGVDRSAPVSCGETGGPAAQGPQPDPAPPTAAAQQTVIANDRTYAQQCLQASTFLLPYVGTVDAARDLDRIRAALGDQELTYIGHSYGTLLGLTYAAMFPTHVRAMVLDGVIDPAIDTEQMVTDQAVGFEKILDDFFAWCASTGCPWHGGSDPTGALLDLVASARQSPIPAGGGRSAGPGEIYTAVLSALYNQGSWARLGQSLAAAAAGDGAGLVAMSDLYNSENGPNSVDADTAISCMDHPVTRDTSAYPQMAARAGVQAPFFGPMLIWGLAECAVWPIPPSRQPAPVRADGAPPILVVGSSGDPATPHQWAVNVAGELAHGVLVTWTGQSHVAYYYSPCVRALDQAYLLFGSLPPSGTVCND